MNIEVADTDSFHEFLEKAFEHLSQVESDEEREFWLLMIQYSMADGGSIQND